MDALDWVETAANPVYKTTRPGDLWCASIDFKILAIQKRGGLGKFKKRTTKIQREDANMKVAMDRAAAVALRRLAGETDESPDASSDEYDDEYYNGSSGDE